MLTLGKSSSKTLLMGGLLLLAFGLVTTGFTQERTHSRNGDNIGFPDLVGELKHEGVYAEKIMKVENAKNYCSSNSNHRTICHESFHSK